jgi:hypothetical protein
VAGKPSKPKSEFCIICRIAAPCTSEARKKFTSEPRNTHKKAVVDLALGDWASLANVWSLGRVTASLQTETHAETPEGGSIGAFICSLISTSKWKVLFHYCMK